MPIIKSAQKRVRQTEKRRAQNIVTKQSMRGSIKAFLASLDSKDSTKITEALREAQSAIDTATKKNVLHKNTASRKKAALSAKAKTAGAKPVTATAKKAAGSKAATKPATKAPAKKPVAKKA